MPAPLERRLVDRLYARGEGNRWETPRELFAAALEASVARAFADREPSAREIEAHVSALHLTDLTLACACAAGHDGAWEHFMRELRPGLYRAADAIDPSGSARDLADSLYADLYGLPGEGRERRSLFRYYHGRSSLATWLRAVLAQRHVDAIRAGRRVHPLPDDEASMPSAPQPIDPDRSRLVALLDRVLRAAVAALPDKDRLRLRSYYAVGMTLAAIGRLTGEHEATVSRNLARTRRTVREDAMRRLREEGLREDELERAFELAIEDSGTLDVRDVFGTAERKETGAQRSQ